MSLFLRYYTKSFLLYMLRNNSVLSKKPIVILSGMITAKIREEMASMPRLCFLPKPASPEALEGAIRDLFNDMKVGA